MQNNEDIDILRKTDNFDVTDQSHFKETRGTESSANKKLEST